MKKFIFSAIAMVAFMGSSVANTIEVKENIETVNFLEELRYSCMGDMLQTYNELVVIVGGEEAWDNASAEYAECIKG